MKRLVLVALGLILIFGCGKTVNLFISGVVYRAVYDSYQYGATWVSVMCDPILNKIEVKLNDKDLEVLGEVGRDFEFYASDTLIPPAKSEWRLKVTTDVGNADATSKVPGDFTATIPNSIAKNADLNLSWTQAEDANWYLVLIEYDTSWYYFYKDTTIYTSQTRLTIPGSWFNKDGYLDIFIGAVNGPKPEAGSKGNINGAKGFWVGANERGGDVQVGEGTQMAKRLEPKKRSAKEIYKRYLKVLAVYNEEAAEILRRMK